MIALLGFLLELVVLEIFLFVLFFYPQPLHFFDHSLGGGVSILAGAGAFTCPFSFHGDKVRWWLGDIYGIASIPIGMEDLCFALWLFLMCTQRWIRTWAQLSNSNPAQCGVSFWVRLAIHLPTTWAISFLCLCTLKLRLISHVSKTNIVILMGYYSFLALKFIYR